MNLSTANKEPNKTDVGNGSQGICRVIAASHSTPPDSKRSLNCHNERIN
jgi:hypothetical protein